LHRLVAPLLAVPLLTLVPAPAHAIGTCQGQAATIESAGGTVTGTEGPDVILVTGFATVTALGGDDVICVVGGDLDAGAGDDSVSVTLAAVPNANFQRAVLGPGANRYTSTGAMSDSVTSGVPDAPNVDVVDLGPGGGDGLAVTLAPGSAVTATAGPAVENDILAVHAVAGDSASWDVTLPATVSRAGVSMGTFTNFPSHTILDLGPDAAATVRGTDRPDRVTLGVGSVDATLGAGQDFVTIDGHFGTAPSSGRLDLGAGRDMLSVGVNGRLRADLDRGRLGGLKVRRLERSVLAAKRVRVKGSTRGDEISAIGCRVVMRGGPGDDELAKASDEWRVFLPRCRQYRLTEFGQGGDDSLRGWSYDDHLDGGRGRDQANGLNGTDWCRAEAERHCER
jgi:hypothetical protein